uniref:MYB-CC type transcription factor LHEQLE-containing domain-containing protein n=1 Tax=Oryza glaberrima TaxID=4538 RepID=I1Q4E5_ORYGL
GAYKKVNIFLCMQAEKHLQMRVEAQEKYMRSMMEKAHQALASGATWPAADEQAKISPPGRK